MAKYIVNIILVTACLFTYTSCIRKMNLYDENRNTGQDNNEKDTDSTPVYMYPFDKETANVTAEIIIHTKKEIQTKDINVEIPHLKYNKTWMLMLTQDDCMQAAFCRTWAAINGKPISSSIPYPTPTPTDHYILTSNICKKGIFPLLLFPPTNLWDVQTEQEMKFGLLLLPLLPLKKNGWMLKQTYCRGLLQTIIVFI